MLFSASLVAEAKRLKNNSGRDVQHSWSGHKMQSCGGLGGREAIGNGRGRGGTSEGHGGTVEDPLHFPLPH